MKQTMETGKQDSALPLVWLVVYEYFFLKRLFFFSIKLKINAHSLKKQYTRLPVLCLPRMHAPPPTMTWHFIPRQVFRSGVWNRADKACPLVFMMWISGVFIMHDSVHSCPSDLSEQMHELMHIKRTEPPPPKPLLMMKNVAQISLHRCFNVTCDFFNVAVLMVVDGVNAVSCLYTCCVSIYFFFFI